MLQRITASACLVILSLMIWGLGELSVMPYAANKNSPLLGKGEIEVVWGMIAILIIAWVACLRWLLKIIARTKK